LIKTGLYIAFFVFPTILIGQNLYDASHSKIYAGHLFDNKEYIAAVQEYKRLLSLKPCDDSLKLKALISYRLGGHADSAVFFAKNYPQCGGTLRENVIEEYCKDQILLNKYKELDSSLYRYSITHTPGSPYRYPVFDAPGTTFYKFEFYAHCLDYNRINDSELISLKPFMQENNFNKWIRLEQKENDLKYKSPALAISLSVIPGLGKVYTDDWKDGVVSALIVGSMGYESYVGFHARGTRSVFGWIFAGLTVGFYGGNIYGSYTSAIRYNRRLDNEIHDEAEKLVISDF